MQFFFGSLRPKMFATASALNKNPISIKVDESFARLTEDLTNFRKLTHQKWPTQKERVYKKKKELDIEFLQNFFFFFMCLLLK